MKYKEDGYQEINRQITVIYYQQQTDKYRKKRITIKQCDVNEKLRGEEIGMKK